MARADDIEHARQRLHDAMHVGECQKMLAEVIGAIGCAEPTRQRKLVDDSIEWSIPTCNQGGKMTRNTGECALGGAS